MLRHRLERLRPSLRNPGRASAVVDLFLVVDGGFGDWSEWGACSAACGEGQSVRRRLCDHPAPQYGGRKCEGPAEESKTCIDVPCPAPPPGPGNHIYLF